jgi:hypothetical protein
MNRSSPRFLLSRGLLGAALLAVSASAVEAQGTQERPPPGQVADTSALVFEREVFMYPRYERRNPFVRLVAGDQAGPRFEEVRLIGVVFSPDPAASLAVLGPREGLVEGREGGGQVYRLRRGETLGNFRIVEIQRSRVVVVVDDFGMTEQRIMELPRPGQGGLS